MATLFTCSLLAGFLNPSASMARSDDDDHLHQQQDSVTNRIEQTSTHVDEISAELMRAQRLVDQAEADLLTAQSKLASLHAEVAQAERVDQEMQAKLENAIIRLENARADLEQGQVDVTATRASLAGYAVSNYQSGGIELSSLGVAFDSQTAQDAVDTFQDVDTVVNKEAVALQELQAQEVLFRLTRERVRETKEVVRDNRRLAAENLAGKQVLEAEAAQAEREVAQQVETLRLEQRRVEAAKRAELEKLSQLEGERKRIENQLRKLAERRARQHQTTIKVAPPPEVAAPAEPAPPAEPGAPTNPSSPSRPSPTSTDPGILGYPGSSTVVTSTYGMRLHPILNIYKLHDGADFSAACGSEVYAAADGRITDAYYNAGYGNRMIIDHGYVEGVSLATSYNHLTSFVVAPGESVARGQLIAYSGTTGYSTACHMHFMVYVNGGTVDPLAWL